MERERFIARSLMHDKWVGVRENGNEILFAHQSLKALFHFDRKIITSA